MVFRPMICVFLVLSLAAPVYAGSGVDPLLRKNRQYFFRPDGDGGVKTTPDVDHVRVGSTDVSSCKGSANCFGGPLAAGTPIDTVGQESNIAEGIIESDAGVKQVGTAIRQEMLDSTAGSEDVALRLYRKEDGVSKMAFYSGPALAAAPTGAYAPAFGCIAIADRVAWDPAAKGSGGAYVVWYDGDSWRGLDDQAD